MNLYFMMLVGAIAGLTSWFAVIVLLRLFPQLSQSRFLDAMNMSILGMCICGMAVGFSDYWSEGKILTLWLATGSFLGLLVGSVAGLAAITIHAELGESLPIAARLIPWTLAGGVIGFGAGSRWFGVNLYRPVIATIGGMAGAAIGGFIFTLSGQVLPDATDFVQATAFVITGVGISTGVTAGPTLLSTGLLQVLSSNDQRTMNKCAGREWLLNDGDKIRIGSIPLDQSKTFYGKEVDINLPDPAVAKRHATVFARHGRYFIEIADENADDNGWPLKPLFVNEDKVCKQSASELLHGDIITVGTTQLYFETRESEPHKV